MSSINDNKQQPEILSTQEYAEICHRLKAAHELGVILKHRIENNTPERVPYPAWIIKALRLDTKEPWD